MLHPGREVLDAQADALETQVAQGFQLFAGRRPRVDLQGDLGVWRDREVEAQRLIGVGYAPLGRL
jgi:hypothetical protein